MDNKIIDALRDSLPPTFSRKVAAEHLAGIFSPGWLAVLDSKGKGPGGVRVGRVVAYEKEEFLTWLEGRLKPDAPFSGKKEA